MSKSHSLLAVEREVDVLVRMSVDALRLADLARDLQELIRIRKATGPAVRTPDRRKPMERFTDRLWAADMSFFVGDDAGTGMGLLMDALTLRWEIKHEVKLRCSENSLDDVLSLVNASLGILAGRLDGDPLLSLDAIEQDNPLDASGNYTRCALYAGYVRLQLALEWYRVHEASTTVRISEKERQKRVAYQQACVMLPGTIGTSDAPPVYPLDQMGSHVKALLAMPLEQRESESSPLDNHFARCEQFAARWMSVRADHDEVEERAFIESAVALLADAENDFVGPGHIGPAADQTISELVEGTPASELLPENTLDPSIFVLRDWHHPEAGPPTPSAAVPYAPESPSDASASSSSSVAPMDSGVQLAGQFVKMSLNSTAQQFLPPPHANAAHALLCGGALM